MRLLVVMMVRCISVIVVVGRWCIIRSSGRNIWRSWGIYRLRGKCHRVISLLAIQTQMVKPIHHLYNPHSSHPLQFITRANRTCSWLNFRSSAYLTVYRTWTRNYRRWGLSRDWVRSWFWGRRRIALFMVSVGSC